MYELSIFTIVFAVFFLTQKLLSVLNCKANLSHMRQWYVTTGKCLIRLEQTEKEIQNSIKDANDLPEEYRLVQIDKFNKLKRDCEEQIENCLNIRRYIDDYVKNHNLQDKFYNNIDINIMNSINTN